MLAARSVVKNDGKRQKVAYQNPKTKQFVKAEYEDQVYTHRMNFYTIPPTEDISLEDFERWSIARLKILAELESCTYRNMTSAEITNYITPLLNKFLPLHSNTSRESETDQERKKDHYSHWTLRLAFSATEDLRRRFARLETQLFRLRLAQDDVRERKAFIEGLSSEGVDFKIITADEKNEVGGEGVLKAATAAWKKDGEGNEGEAAWFKVPFEKVAELVEHRKCLVRNGVAYVHVREQMGMVVGDFTRRLEAGLDVAARALPRMDEDSRLAPILAHLSKSFDGPGNTSGGWNDGDEGLGDGMMAITARNIDQLASLFPLCMQNLHRDLRKNSHLKHFGRVQYTLFLKGIGVDMNECISFWRSSFKLITDDKFKKEYLYNIRHSYGDVGGDANRRGKGYSPYSCQKLLTEGLPGPGQSHGCPYRTFTPDNLISLLQATGISDRDVLKTVREDIGRQRYHIACNRVFEYKHKAEIKKVKDENLWGPAELDTIVHPNTYFKRGFLLANLNMVKNGDIGVDNGGMKSEAI